MRLIFGEDGTFQNFFRGKDEHKALIQSGIIVVLFLVLYWLSPASSWETNDDVYYNLVVSGKLLTSAPDAHIVVVNYCLSSLFVLLYTFLPNLPWYGLFHVTSLLFSVFFLNYCYGLARQNEKFCVRVVVSLLTVLPFLVYLQFTKTALMLGVAGLLGLYLLNEASSLSCRHSLILHISALLLIVLSFSLRKESFFLAVILCGAFLAQALLQRKRALITTTVAASILITLFALVHMQNYGAEWQDFNRLGRLSNAILNYGHYGFSENRDVYQQVGWSWNDYNLFRSWGYSDPNVFSPDDSEYIFENARVKSGPRPFFASLRAATAFPATNYLLTLAILAVLMVIIYRRNLIFLFLGVLLPLLVCAVFLTWEGRFPTRVSTAMACASLWVVLVQSGTIRSQALVLAASVLALTVAAVPVYGQAKDLSEIARYRQNQNIELWQLGAQAAQRPFILVVMGASFPYEGILPFSPIDDLSGIRIVWLCGMNQTPVQKKQLADLGIDDLFSDLTSKRDMYIALAPVEVGIVRQYILEHYQQAVNLLPIYSRSTMRLYRVVN